MSASEYASRAALCLPSRKLQGMQHYLTTEQRLLVSASYKESMQTSSIETSTYSDLATCLMLLGLFELSRVAFWNISSEP